MKKFLLGLILTLSSGHLMAVCRYPYSLNSLQYNCQIQKVGGTEIEQFAADCDCERSAKQHADGVEAPVHAVSDLTCKQSWVNINNTSKPDSDFHQFVVKTYLKNVPITANTALRTRYLKVRKSKCSN